MERLLTNRISRRSRYDRLRRVALIRDTINAHSQRSELLPHWQISDIDWSDVDFSRTSGRVLRRDIKWPIVLFFKLAWPLLVAMVCVCQCALVHFRPFLLRCCHGCRLLRRRSSWGLPSLDFSSSRTRTCKRRA